MTTSPLGRIIEIAEDGRYLAKSRGFLTVAAGGAEIGRVPLDDVGAVIATSPSASASCALLSELASRGIPFVLCGRNFAPAAIIWPIEGHHAQQRRIEAQADASKPMGKQLWSRIVAAKINRQAWALMTAGRPAPALERMAGRVKSGDPDNLEARAARLYWPLLMGDAFRRDTDGGGPNALLNYGYAVLRGATARAIVAAGLHPGLGIFHRHPQNTMPLADDLMEPFRPLVDVRVRELLDSGLDTVTTDVKRQLAAILMIEVRTAAGRSPISTCMVRLAASIADSYLTGVPNPEFPLGWLPRRTGAPSDDETDE